MQTLNRNVLCLAASVLLATSGCGSPDGSDFAPQADEPTASALDLFSEASCASATPDYYFPYDLRYSDKYTGVHYSNPKCSKAYIMDFWMPGAQPADSWHYWDMEIEWSDPRTRTRTECEGGKLQFEIFAPPYHDGPFVAPLRWNGSRCVYSSIQFLGGKHNAGPGRVEDFAWISTYDDDNNLLERTVLTQTYRYIDIKVAVDALTPAGSTQGAIVKYWVDFPR
jgi:hypothetical protein